MYIIIGAIIFMALFALLILWAAGVVAKREEEQAEREYQKLLAAQQKDRSKAG